MSDASCVTYACNLTDKTVTLTTNQKFCRNILVTNPLVTIGEHSFIASTESSLESEVSATDFPEHKNQLISIFKNSWETVSIKGDHLKRTDVMQQKINFEKGANPFL